MSTDGAQPSIRPSAAATSSTRRVAAVIGSSAFKIAVSGPSNFNVYETSRDDLGDTPTWLVG